MTKKTVNFVEFEGNLRMIVKKKRKCQTVITITLTGPTLYLVLKMQNFKVRLEFFLDMTYFILNTFKLSAIQKLKIYFLLFIQQKASRLFE